MVNKLVFAVVLAGIFGISGGAFAGHERRYDAEHHRDHATCDGVRHNRQCQLHGHQSSSHYYYHHNRHGDHGMTLD